MPRYTVRITDKDSGKQKLYSYTADSSEQAERRAKGDGFEVLSVMEDVPPPSRPPTYDLLRLAGWILTLVGIVTTVVGVLMALVGLKGSRGDEFYYGCSVALSGVLGVGIGQSMQALRAIAINSFARRSKE